MEILELDVKHFGKFQEHKVKLYPGINVIYGGNESGKSTLHAFIRAMFFGFERRGRGKGNEYQLRRPWENSAYFAGNMRLKYRGELYRVERNFYKNDREVRLVCETKGQELPAGQQELSELLGGLNEAAFCNTVFIPQAGSQTDAGLAEELQRFMVNFQESGDAGLDVAKALERLKARRKELENKKKEEQEQLDEQIDRKRMEADYVRRELQRGEDVPQREGFPGSLEEDFPDAQEADAAAGSGDERFREQAGEPVDRQTGERTHGEAGEPQSDLPKKSAGRTSYGRLLLWLYLLLGLCGVLSIACGVFAAGMAARVVLFGLGLLFLGLLGAVLWDSVRSGQAARALREILAGKTEKSQENVQNPVEFDKTGSRWTVENLQENAQNRETQEEALLRKHMEEGKRRWQEEEERRGRQEKNLRLSVIQEELEELYAQREALFSREEEIAALDLAMERIRELSDRIYREAGEQFSRRASEILDQLTGGRYTRISLDEKMEIRINTPSQLLGIRQVSHGTMDQIYFALRVAAGELLAYGEPLPLILDEAFAMYDDERLEAALRWLDGSRRQVILFTCQKREKNLLEQIRRDA